ncbi:MAG: hypothetical protein R2939_20350 [Kofleriaceae bacterium]
MSSFARSLARRRARAGALAAALAGSLLACIDPSVTVCPDGTTCGGDRVCAPAGGCADPARLAVCDGQVDGADCDTGVGDFGNGVCVRGECRVSVCGDGVIDVDPAQQIFEVCDDGGQDVNGDGVDDSLQDGDGCARGCRSDETCGNGIIDAGEECDRGEANRDTPDAPCRTTCQGRACGDGIVDVASGEGCDEGAANSAAPDAACRPNCQPARCGDGIADLAAGEACDDGNLLSGDGCSGDCLSDETCGNAYPDFAAGEQCDEGPGLTHDGCSSSCRVEQPRWRRWEPTEGYGRRGAAAAYDAHRDRVVVFGGWVGHDVVRPVATTLEFDGAGWRERTDPAMSPPARAEAVMAFDAQHGYVVLFGGVDEAFSPLADTWIFDGESWTVLDAPGPAARRRAVMAYDPARATLLMFGGTGVGDVLLDDTWRLDDGVWTRTGLSGGPSARAGAAMAYDAASARIVLFGGASAAGLQNDAWAFTTKWTSIAATGAPAPRSGHALAGTHGGVVMVGGISSFGQVSNEVAILGGAAWTAQATGPSARGGHVMVTASGNDVVLFGGDDGSILIGGDPDVDGGPAGETWRRDAAGWDDVSPGLAPPPRTSTAMAYDRGRATLVLFGGGRPGFLEQPPLADTWEYRGARWERRGGATPPPRSGHAMAYDEARGVVVLFGGVGTTLFPLDDTWEYDGERWTQRPGPGPSARSMAGLAYDPSRGGLVLFGGAGDDDQLDDTWTYVDGAWALLPTAMAPPPRLGAGMAYDRVGARLIVHGGIGTSVLTDTWQLVGDAWTMLGEPGPASSADVWGRLTYDDARARVTLLLGTATWELDGDSWREVDSVDAPAPSPGAVLASDGRSHRLVMVGGLAGTLAAPTDEIWEFGYEAPASAAEACDDASVDSDGDGLAGCDDPDCWPWCQPLCPPLTSCPLDAPGCGDGTCDPLLETALRCPLDCA